MIALLKSLFANRRGSVAVNVGLLTIPLLGTIGAAVDYSAAMRIRAELSASADAAALLGARIIADADRKDVVEKYAVGNIEAMDAKSVVIARPGVSFQDQERLATVTISATYQTQFMRLFGVGSLDINARATAKAGEAAVADACILALDPNGAGITFNGSVIFEAPKCAMISNAKGKAGAESMRFLYEGKYTAAYFAAHGAVKREPKVTLTPVAVENAPVVADPVTFTQPSVGACNHTNYNRFTGSNFSISPGVYCGGMTIEGAATITANPGTYIIKDGPLKITGAVILKGTGVSFVLVGPNARVEMTGSAILNLSAPKSGPLTNFVLAKAKGQGNGNSFFTGSALGALDGLIYLPEESVKVSGSGIVDYPAVRSSVLIVKEFAFEGALIAKIRYEDRIAPLKSSGGSVYLVN